MAEKKKPPKVADLSPPAQAAIKQKGLEGKYQFREWLRILEELSAFDAVTDEIQAKAGKRAGWFGFLLVLAIVGTIVSAATGLVFLAPIAILAGLAFLVFLIMNLVTRSKMKKVDICDDLRNSLMPFLDLIGEDVGTKGKASMKLDLAGLNKVKITRKEKIPPGPYNKVIETVYEDPWCEFSAVLADGTRMQLQLHTQAVSHDRHWTKRSRSGKIKFKHKRKWKKLVQASAALVPDGETFEWGEEPAVEGKIKVADKKYGRVCQLTRKWKFSSVGNAPAESVSPDELVGMFIQLCGMLKPVEKGA
ncbi:MAG: phage holin family protein [Kiritimatiellae bacterium]|nr:phage holin family protein [Kiritimatiellia bacterium]